MPPRPPSYPSPTRTDSAASTWTLAGSTPKRCSPRPTPCTGATPRTTLPPQPGVPSSAPGREPKAAAAASVAKMKAAASCSREPRPRARRSYGDTATKRPRARTPQLVPQRRVWQRQGRGQERGQGRGQERRWLGRRRSLWEEVPGRPHQVTATLTATTAGVAAVTLAATVAVVSGGTVAALPAALPALLPASAAAAAAADPLRWIAHPAAVAVRGVRSVAARWVAVAWLVAAARQVAPRQAPAPTCVTRLNSASLPRKAAVGMRRRATHAMPITRTARP